MNERVDEEAHRRATGEAHHLALGSAIGSEPKRHVMAAFPFPPLHLANLCAKCNDDAIV